VIDQECKEARKIAGVSIGGMGGNAPFRRQPSMPRFDGAGEICSGWEIYAGRF
jgi:hypothetical protein